MVSQSRSRFSLFLEPFFLSLTSCGIGQEQRSGVVPLVQSMALPVLERHVRHRSAPTVTREPLLEVADMAGRSAGRGGADEGQGWDELRPTHRERAAAMSVGKESGRARRKGGGSLQTSRESRRRHDVYYMGSDVVNIRYLQSAAQMASRAAPSLQRLAIADHMRCSHRDGSPTHGPGGLQASRGFRGRLTISARVTGIQ